MHRKKTVSHQLLLSFTGFLAATLAVGLWAPRMVHAQKKFVFSIGWVFYGRDLGWLTAREKGFYREEGLSNFEIVRGFGGGDTMTKVAAGAYTIGGSVPPIPQIIA